MIKKLKRENKETMKLHKLFSTFVDHRFECGSCIYETQFRCRKFQTETCLKDASNGSEDH